MSSQGPLYTGTGADDSTIGTVAWSNPGNITSSNDVYASATLGVGVISHYIKATNFGFTIPTDSTILGILMECERNAGVGVVDNSVKLVKGGTIGGTDKSTGSAWQLTDTIQSYGGSSDLWGQTWTVSDINASNFGAVVSAIGDTPAGGTGNVDAIRITVTYSAAGGLVNIAVAQQNVDWNSLVNKSQVKITSANTSIPDQGQIVRPLIAWRKPHWSETEE